MKAPAGRRPTRLTRGAAVAAVLTTATAALLVAAAVRALQEEPFPHEAHEGLFPLCTGCHEGITSPAAAGDYPSPALCARCHDGVQEERVAWDGPQRRAGNLRFEHGRHADDMAEAGDERATCLTCHGSGADGRMAVADGPDVQGCLGCHAHRAEEHYRDADCSTCHEPLAATGFAPERVASLPLPGGHEEPAFVLEGHGRDATAAAERCATCHTRERCEACHVAADRDEILAVPAAGPGMDLPGFAAHYPVPGSHEDEGWLAEHGQQAGVGACATCHTRQDCRACHVATVPQAVEALPSRADVVAPGVMLEARAPESHSSPFFAGDHGAPAAADGGACATCHTERFCVACHDAPPGGGYHPPDFVARHAAEGYGRDAECATCHDAAVFCRSCHIEAGLGSSGRLGPGYHDAEPLWLLRHGQAARQNLESCASCHEQRQCLQCHGVLGAFKVNPHGREFDARAAWARNPRPCLACHLRNPLEGG